jgi:hypothetical protein
MTTGERPGIPGIAGRAGWRDEDAAELEAISIVQRGNLKALEATLRKQWRLGQNIVLCWSSDERGVLVLFVPHYFLGNYCAADDGNENETFIRQLISGRRRKSREELFDIAARLDVAPTFIKLNTALTEEDNVLLAVEQVIKRYGISFVDKRAVLLFDIADFSLFTPFEQASQLNSLSYSLNNAYNKLLSKGVEINFARTTTGDGYYVWNRSLKPFSNQDLFYFMLLVVVDNSVARAASRGNTVPVIRTAYHIGSHYELYQAEGVNPTVFSYIVGNVTIELARMIDLAQPHQILLGDFECELPTTQANSGKLSVTVSSPEFVRNCNRELDMLRGIQLSNRELRTLACHLTETTVGAGESVPRRFRITDKHGLSRHAYNLQIDIDIDGNRTALGLGEESLPGRVASAMPRSAAVPGGRPTEAASAEALFDDLASLLQKRATRIYSDD